MNCDEVKRTVGIRAVLESFQRFPVKDNPKTAFYFALDRDERTASLSVDFVKNKAFDFGTGKSYDVISIVQVINKCSVSEALRYLSSFDHSVEVGDKNAGSKKMDNYEIVGIDNVRHPALLQYLKERKVFEQRHLLREVHYVLNGRKYFGVGFENNSGGFEIRNRYSKICLGKKDISLIDNEKNLENEIIIFEGFFDYLTFRMINDEECLLNIMVLNSTSLLFKVQEKLKDYKKLILYFDNDANGRTHISNMRKRFAEVEDRSFIYEECKDLNEWFVLKK